MYVHNKVCAYNSENNTQTMGIPASVRFCCTTDAAGGDVGGDVAGAVCVPPEPVRSTGAGSVTIQYTKLCQRTIQTHVRT